MIECFFCCSNDKESYLFTECKHLVCHDCTVKHWDRKYSIKCCGITTFLSAEICNILSCSNQQETKTKNIEQKENREQLNDLSYIQSPKYYKANEQINNMRPKHLVQSLVVKSFEPLPKNQVVFEDDKRKEDNLRQMQKILSEEVSKVRSIFQIYKKDLERREQVMLKQIYNKYSEHLASLKTSCSDHEVIQLREKFQRLANSDIPPVMEKQESRQDKILEKLDYNQQKMKEKLSKHYMLLK